MSRDRAFKIMSDFTVTKHHLIFFSTFSAITQFGLGKCSWKVHCYPTFQL